MKPLREFYIKNFRLFTELDIPTLKRVNLFAGKNNVGKSCLLEALYIYLKGLDLDVLKEVLQRIYHQTFEDNHFKNISPENNNLIQFFPEFIIARSLGHGITLGKDRVRLFFQTHKFTSEQMRQIGELGERIPYSEEPDASYSCTSLMREQDGVLKELIRFNTAAPVKEYGTPAKNKCLLFLSEGLPQKLRDEFWDNIQVFATTHSRDGIYAFREAWKNFQEEVFFGRIDKKTDRFVMEEYSLNELEEAIETMTEVR